MNTGAAPGDICAAMDWSMVSGIKRGVDASNTMFFSESVYSRHSVIPGKVREIGVGSFRPLFIRNCADDLLLVSILETNSTKEGSYPFISE